MLKKNCSNCEFNFSGTCVGHGETYKYGEKIKDNTTKCSAWGANLECFTYEINNAPRFLREKYNDCSISYEDFSKLLDDYSEGKVIPINLFDAIKFVCGLSVVDIAVLMNVSFGVVYNAKVRGIPAKRIKQFSEALCIDSEMLLNGTTAVFPSLYEAKKDYFEKPHIKKALTSMPDWKKDLSEKLSSRFLHCPIHLAKEFARIDNFCWQTGIKTDDFTSIELLLIDYMKKHQKTLVNMEYSLDRACSPHIHFSVYTDK